MSDTRVLYLPPPEDSYPGAYINSEFGKDDVTVDGRQFTEVTQQPIPWCTTHNKQAKFDEGDLIGQGAKICVVSTGGLDHKWWKDE